MSLGEYDWPPSSNQEGQTVNPLVEKRTNMAMQQERMSLTLTDLRISETTEDEHG